MVKILGKSVVNKKMRRHFHRFRFVNSEKDSSVGEGFGPPAHHPLPPPPPLICPIVSCTDYSATEFGWLSARKVWPKTFPAKETTHQIDYIARCLTGQ